MNNNILLKNKQNYINRVTQQTIQNNSVDNEVPTNTNGKYNPDVVNKFKQLSNTNNASIKPTFVPNYYKSITNQPINTNIKSIDELKLIPDKPDALNIEQNYDANLKERLMEQNSFNKSLSEYNKQHNVQSSDNIWNPPTRFTPKKHTIYNDNVSILQNNGDNFTKLKNDFSSVISSKTIDSNQIKEQSSSITSYSLNENDKLLNEKKRYNKILEDLDSLL